jgi:DNA replication protein DnaC
MARGASVGSIWKSERTCCRRAPAWSPAASALRVSRWVDEDPQVLVTWATGTGKSFIDCALAHPTCHRGYRADYRRASRLFDDLKLARMDALVLDDWCLAPVQDQERRDLLATRPVLRME